MTTTLDTQAAASALATLLPSPTVLAVVSQPAGEVPDFTMGVAVDHVGQQSIELALLFSTRAEQTFRGAGGGGSFSLGDVVRPAFEAAASVLGPGVLGEVAETASPALFTDSGAAVYQLLEGGAAAEQNPYAWLAIKVRSTAGIGGAELTAANLGRIHDVEMALSVVIGRTRMSVANVLGLEPGDVVDLDRSAGSPADVLLNGRLIAHGEVVVVDQDYAVRITRILDTAETVG